MSELSNVTAAIFRHVDFVAVVDRLNRGKRHASLGPQPSKHDLFATRLFNGRYEVLVVPRVHGRTLDGFLPREYGSQLRPHISAEGLRLDRGQNHRYIEHPCGFSECHSVVDDSLAIEIACSKQHLALMVDQRHDAIVRGQESLLTKLGTISV